MTLSSETLIELRSHRDFARTLERIIGTIRDAGMTLFAQIDHAAAARAVGLTMPPTVVLLYGNPKGGTPIMLATPRVALDLPLRVSVREDETGTTLVAFHSAERMLRDAGVADAMVTRLEGAQQILVNALQ